MKFILKLLLIRSEGEKLEWLTVKDKRVRKEVDKFFKSLRIQSAA